MPPIEVASFAGIPVSRLVKGSWQLHERAGDLDRAAALADMYAFADAGITSFEAADIYTGVEALVGEFLSQRRAQRLSAVRVHTRLSVVSNEEISDKRVAAAINRTRERLGIARLTLVQLSMWRFDRDRWRAAGKHLAGLATQGLIERLGVMNVDVDAIDDLRERGVPVAAAQAQFSLLDRRAERTLVPACRAAGLGFFGYGALAGGLIGQGWLGRADPGMTGPFHAEYRVIIEQFGGWARFQRLLRVLDRIARRHDVDIGTIALRWALDRPGVTAILVGASNTSHLADLARLSALTLDDNDSAEIAEVLAQSTGPTGPVGALERDSTGPLARAIARRGLAVPRA